jgi:SAM-dependent methyltransferase
VWLRHLKLLHESGLRTKFATVAELGPGDSLGIGLGALLCGADRLYALDVVRYADLGRNTSVLTGLVDLFRQRAAIPDDREFPELRPRLADYTFPHEALPDAQLEAALAPERVAAIGRALKGEAATIVVSYKVPWTELAPHEEGSIDLVLSQAVLEHVEDLEWTYRALGRWVAPDGVMSHVIDHRSHQLTRTWDGHLAYSQAVWRIVKGRRPYLLNREPPQRHLRLLEQAGFRAAHVHRELAQQWLPRERLCPRFQEWSEEDRRTAGLVLQAARSGSPREAQR